MEISELKKEQRFYDVSNNNVIWYTYLEPHPHSESYHILIDSFEIPLRLHKSQLQLIIDKELDTYEKAQLYLADLLESRVKFLRKTKNKK